MVRNVALSRRLRIDPPLIQRLFDRFIARPGQPDPFGAGVFGNPLRQALEAGAVSPRSGPCSAPTLTSAF